MDHPLNLIYGRSWLGRFTGAGLMFGAMGAGAEALTAPNGKMEKLAGDFAFTEGPAADRQGNLYFSDIPKNHIHVWGLDGQLRTFRDDTQGANGLYFGHDGALFACEGAGRRIVRYGMNGEVATVVDRFEGKRLNSPNDLWVDPKGGIYFTDPRYGKSENMEIEGFHVYYIKPGLKEIVRVIDDLVKPNGVKGSKDGKRLLVADHGDHKTWTYDIHPDGTLGGGRVIVERGADGLTLDERGNIYLTPQAPTPERPGMEPPGSAITIYNPGGKLLETIEVPEKPANVAFAGPDNQTLFITARTSLYAIRMAVKGQ